MAHTRTGIPDREIPIGAKEGWGNRRHVARLVLVVFLITFFVTRTLVFLIMNRTFPDMFIYIGGTHVHHLNLGIFLLSGVGAYLLFARPTGRWTEAAAVLYGIGLALTFDEFGMWLHLGGGYWQRASFDAITVVGGLLTLLAFGPPLQEVRGKHMITVLILLVLGAVFFFLLIQTVNRYGEKAQPHLEKPGQTGRAGVARARPAGYSDADRAPIPA